MIKYYTHVRAHLNFCSVIIVLTYNIANLVREKDKWGDEEKRLLDEQKNLAFKHYQSFVTTAACSNDIRLSFDMLEERLGCVIGTVPDLLESLQGCSKLAVNTNTM